MGERGERLGANEALFREVNERIADLSGDLLAEAEREVIKFTCECARVDCAELIPMGLEAYEAVRTSPIRFAVVPGHEQLEVERVVERHRSYLVVEKTDEEAEEVARKSDPRDSLSLT